MERINFGLIRRAAIAIGEMSGISSKDSEHDEALTAAKELRDKMAKDYNWPLPVYADSGNGSHLQYRIDFPNDKESTDLVKKVLVKLNKTLNHPRLEIDPEVCTAARLTKLYGTWVRKGDEVDDRHHRQSRIIDAPTERVPISKEQLLEFIAEKNSEDGDANKAKHAGEEAKDHLGQEDEQAYERNYTGPGHIDNLETWLTEHGLTWKKQKGADNGGTIYVLDKCPSCGNSDACCHVASYPPPKNGFHAACKHKTCDIKRWSDFRKKIEPDYYVPYVLHAGASTGPVVKSEWEKGYFVHTSGKTLKGTTKKDGEKTASWIADGYAYIDSILEAYNTNTIVRYFVIKGRSIRAPAEDEFKITIKATDASENRKLEAALVNEFGRDPIGDLDLQVIHRLSANREIPFIRVFDRPIWLNNRLIAPGLTEDAEFRFPDKVAIDFRPSGGAAEGKKALEGLIEAFPKKNSVLLVATCLGAPVTAKLWPDERYALFLRAPTGQKKTAAVMVVMCLFGVRYSIEATLVHWGDGATSNATEHIAVKTGPFPFPLDNYKAYTDQDPSRIQRAIHAMLEGTEKDRMEKDRNDMRESLDYLCTPVITGENYPGQDAATRARIVLIEWVDAIGDINPSLTDAQNHVKDLNAFGKEYMQWLSSPEGNLAMIDQAGKFDEVRGKYLKKIPGATNAGRIATNAAVIRLSWEAFAKWPVAEDIARKYAHILEEAIDELVLRAKTEVEESLDAEKFISWLQAEVYVGSYYPSCYYNQLGQYVCNNIPYYNLGNYYPWTALLNQYSASNNLYWGGWGYYPGYVGYVGYGYYPRYWGYPGYVGYGYYPGYGGYPWGYL